MARGGFRPNAGRRPQLSDKDLKEIVSMSAMTIMHALTAKKPESEEYVLPLETRAELASKFVIKAMPSADEGEGRAGVIVYITNNDPKSIDYPKQVLPAPSSEEDKGITSEI